MRQKDDEFEKLHKAYRFYIYSTIEQDFFVKTFGCVRFIYNRMLAERKETYENLNTVILKA